MINPIKTIVTKSFSLRDVANEIFTRMPPEKRYEPQEITLLTADDLMSFASKCKCEYPQIDHCSVYCEIMTDRAAFRITQLMVDANGAVIRSNGNPISRIVYAQRLDARIHARLDGSLPAEFDFQLV